MFGKNKKNKELEKTLDENKKTLGMFNQGNINQVQFPSDPTVNAEVEHQKVLDKAIADLRKTGKR